MPVKFADIPKEATAILNDDYVVSGYVFKTKQKTSWAGAVFSSQVDLFPDDKCATPAKLTWKLPKPFGAPFAIDKLEMDKGGKFKLEASKDAVIPGLKVECKTDLADINKVVIVDTYTGIKDAQCIFEFKATKPMDFVAEATYTKGIATCGLKFDAAVLKGGLPDVGARFASGPFFCALMATKGLSTFDLAASYKATPEVKVAASCQATAKGGLGSAQVGAVCKGLYKVKVAMDGSACVSLKHDVAPGFSLLGGLKYGSKGVTYGCQLSIE